MPILVKKDNSTNSKKFMIIAGERRWRACKSLKMKTINAIVIEKIQVKNQMLWLPLLKMYKEKTSPVLEEAIAYDKLIKNYKMKHEDIAKSTGKSRSYITNLLRI